MLTAALAVLCALLVLVLLVQRPAIWPVLVVLAVLWFALFGVFRYRARPAGGTQGQRPAAQSGRRRVERSQLHRPRRGREHDPSCPE